MKTIAIFHNNRILKWKMVIPLDETKLQQHSATGDLGVTVSRLSSSLRGGHLGKFTSRLFPVPQGGPCSKCLEQQHLGSLQDASEQSKKMPTLKDHNTQPVLFLSLLLKPHPGFVSRQWFFHQSCELITKNQNYRVYRFPVWKGMLDSLHGNLLQLSVGKTHITCIKYNARYFFLLLDPNFIQF